MSNSNFDKRVLIEQIRYLEAEQKLACDAEQDFLDHAGHKDFEQRLWQRAQCLIKQYGLSSLLARAARISRYIRTIVLLMAALTGMIAVLYAVTDSNTINIYWLLLVLLGFNFLSMLLWLTGISLNLKGLSSGLFASLSGRLSARLSGWLSGHGERHSYPEQFDGKQADRAWLACHFSGAVGKWELSKLTHQLWLTYLFAGLVFLVLLLMVRQYDFVWGTTLLSDDAFVKLTGWLSVPLDALGFATPSSDQVQHTRIGVSLDAYSDMAAAQSITAEYRGRWAQFLLGALLCFGLLPRLLLWGISILLSARSRRLFSLDYYLPYYISLRQQLLPLASHAEVVDADTSPPDTAVTPAQTQATAPVPHTLPAETRWVAVELGDQAGWPPSSISDDNYLGQVIDRESLSRIQQGLQSLQGPQLAVAVSASRAPDRGIQRTIADLMSNSGQRWLVLLYPDHEKPQQDEPISARRLAAWYRLAEACAVPADHLISMRLA